MRNITDLGTRGLLLCIVMDFIGTVSFSIPIIGEFSDLIWAPLAAFLYKRLFSGVAGWIGSILVFTEELLPFTDFIPTFTLSWIGVYLFSVGGAKNDQNSIC